MNRRSFSWRRAAVLLLLALALALPALLVYVVLATRPYRYDTAAEAPAQRVAIVFGAGIRDGRPSPILAARIRGAVELYEAGRVSKILMTGDNSRVDYDEVSAMRRYAIDLGVPAEVITLDYAGFSTYESCYRARAIFGVTEAVLVTQHYHLPRAVYTCRQLGVEAFGLGIPDWTRNPERSTVAYPPVQALAYSARESLATVKALWDVHITRPPPTFLGNFEGLN